MPITVNRVDSIVLANLILEDVRGYASRHAEDYAAYLKEKQEREQAKSQPIKKRRKYAVA